MTERRERPVSMNAFELISKSQSFSLNNLFEKETVTMSGYSYFRLQLCLPGTDATWKRKFMLSTEYNKHDLVAFYVILGPCEA